MEYEKRGKLILLPHCFLRTPNLVQKAKFPSEPPLVEILQHRELIESVEEASLTRVTYRDFRSRRRKLWFNSFKHNNVKNTGCPSLHHLSIHILHSKSTTTSFWESPTFKLWIQDLVTNHEWTITKSVNDIRELGKQIQAIEEAALDDEVAELALNAAVAAAKCDEQSNQTNEIEESFDNNNQRNIISPNPSEENSSYSLSYDNQNDDDDNENHLNHLDEEEANWKLEDAVIEQQSTSGEGERKGALFQYLLSHGGSNTKHLINKKLPKLLKKDRNKLSNRYKKKNDDDDDDARIINPDDSDDTVRDSDEDELDELNHGELVEEGVQEKSDLADIPGVYYEDVSIVGDTILQQPPPIVPINSTTPSFMPSSSSSSEQALWETLQQHSSSSSAALSRSDIIQADDIFKFVRRIIQMSLLFDPYAKEFSKIPNKKNKKRNKGNKSSENLINLAIDDTIKQANLILLQQEAKREQSSVEGMLQQQSNSTTSTVFSDDELVYPKLLEKEVQQISRIRARRIHVGNAAGTLLSQWISPPPSTRSKPSSTSHDTDPHHHSRSSTMGAPGSEHDTAADELSSKVLLTTNSIARAVRSSFTSQTSIDTDALLSTTSASSNQTENNPILESGGNEGKDHYDTLVAEIRAYTMGILSLPPLARLLAGYMDMMTTELDDIYAESALAAVVSVGETSVGVASSVRSVGKMFSSLISSVYTPDTTDSSSSPPPLPPPPLPPPPLGENSIENDEDKDNDDDGNGPINVHDIMNYWKEESDSTKKKKRKSKTKQKVQTLNTGDNSMDPNIEAETSTGSSTGSNTKELKYAQVRRKAKVRGGIEFENVSSRSESGGGSAADSSAADKVGTLAEGAIVTILDSAIATDGTRRSKVRGTHKGKEVVGWVTTRLLRPHANPNANPTKPKMVGVLTVQDIQEDGTSESKTRHKNKLNQSPIASSYKKTNLNKNENDEDDENKELDFGDGPIHTIMERLADFMAQTTYLIKEACEEDLLLIVSMYTERFVGMEEAEGIIDSGVWRQVEAEVYLPLKSKLISSLTRHTQLEASRFGQRLRSLKALPQTFWSISDKMISKASWTTAINLLNKIQTVTLPSDKVDLLLKAVKAIEAEHMAVDTKQLLEASSSSPSSSSATNSIRDRVEDTPALGADDIFPVFVYVLVQSDLWKGGEIIVLRDLLSSMANPQRQRWSASAYYVATLEAAIEHIKAT